MLFVVDAKVGVTPGDEELAEILRSSRRPVLVLANKLDDPRRDLEALEFHRLGLGDPIPISALHGHGSGDLLDEIVAPAPGRAASARRRGGDQGGDPRAPERRQVVAPERAAGPRARHRLGGPGTTRDAIDTVLAARRHDVRPRRHGRASPQAQAAAGNRVLLGAACARGGRASGRRARPRRREPGSGRSGSGGRGRGPEGAVRDDRRALQVGRTEVRIEDVRPRIATRLRQRPPLIAVSAKTGRGLERLLT